MSDPRVMDAVKAAAGPDASLVAWTQKRWQSATFSGWRDRVTISWSSDAVEAGEAFLGSVTDVDIEVSGLLIADCAVVSRVAGYLPYPSLTAEIEVLVLRDE